MAFTRSAVRSRSAPPASHLQATAHWQCAGLRLLREPRNREGGAAEAPTRRHGVVQRGEVPQRSSSSSSSTSRRPATSSPSSSSSSRKGSGTASSSSTSIDSTSGTSRPRPPRRRRRGRHRPPALPRPPPARRCPPPARPPPPPQAPASAPARASRSAARGRRRRPRRPSPQFGQTIGLRFEVVILGAAGGADPLRAEIWFRHVSSASSLNAPRA